jgi:hypothetical protein
MPIYGRPMVRPVLLSEQPRLESCMAAGHPDLPLTADFMDWYDLDNYLCPLARRPSSKGCQIVSAWGTKGIADHSYFTVGPAVPGASVISYPIRQIELSASSESPAFKETIRSL